MVTSLRDHPAVAVRVRDTGHGMDPEVFGRAKEPFFTTRPRGTGLGLAIVERVALNHGGQMAIDSTPSEGTCVSLLLPTERTSVAPLPPLDTGRRSAPNEAP